MRAILLGAACLVLLTIGGFPFLVFLDAVPLQPDSIKWIENAVPGGEGWAEWTFRGSHFVGYRPLTALSFTADLALFGPSASALRWTDLALHLLSALLVFGLSFRLGRGGAQDHPRSRVPAAVAGLAALTWFALHVGNDEVIPFLSRRSYPLAVCLAFAGLLLAQRVAARASTTGPGVLGRLSAALVGPLLLASLWGNELGALLAVALPFVVFAAAAESPIRRSVLLTAWGWAWIAAGIWIRQRVLDGDSGYEVVAAEPGRAAAVWKLYGTALTGQLGQASMLHAGAAAALASYYAVTCIALARERARSLPLGLLVVLGLYGAVVANEGVWFPRQVYPATALAAVAFGLVAAYTLAGSAAVVLRLPRWAHAIPQVALLLLMVVESPIVQGTATVRAERARVATSFTQALAQDLESLTGAAEVLAVAPVPGPVDETRLDPRASLRASSDRSTARLSAMRVPFRWLRLVFDGAEWKLRDVLYVADPDEQHPPTYEAGEARLRLPAGAAAYGVPRRQILELPSGQPTFSLPKQQNPDLPRYLWIYGSPGLQAL